jgi:hypothetical protein
MMNMTHENIMAMKKGMTERGNISRDLIKVK